MSSVNVTEHDGIMYYYYSNDTAGALFYINDKVERVRTKVAKYGLSKTYAKRLEFFYNEVRAMCYMIVEKSSLSDYDDNFLEAIFRSELELLQIDLDYINKKLKEKEECC